MKMCGRRLVLFTILLFLNAALGQAAFAKERMTVVDLEKRTVEIPKNPERIICLGPGSLRLICYLGMMKKVVGVERFEKTPPVGRAYLWANPDLAKLPPVGPGGPAGINREPDLEAVLKINPQLIFVANMEPGRAEALQKKLNIPVVILSYGGFATFDDIVFDSLRLAGKILQAEKRAEELVAFIEGARRDLQKRTEGYEESKKPRVYIGGIGFRGTQGIESTDASYFPLDWVRARNLAKEVIPKGHTFVDKEKILSWDPEILFIDGGGLGNIRQDYQKKTEFYRHLKAMKNRQVFLLFPYNWYVTNIDTAVADGFAAGKILYPQRFADIEPRKKADEIYSFLLGKPVYPQLEKEFGDLGGTVVLSP
ncbi:MAG: iron ABC transporter substrate-binding protein [Deltaproteobacteria bacterium]|nr:iron ABC transporter substrate-binding protein [Deltaproteobacteria bacterium]